MLVQIKKSGLQNKTKVAQELVRELELFIKSASMKKKADLVQFAANDATLKPVFAYWASAALKKLQEQGEPELDGMLIPDVEASDNAVSYGQRILSALRSEGRERLRLRQRTATDEPSLPRYAKLISDMYEENKAVLKKGISNTKGGFLKNHKELLLTNEDKEDLWSIASNWAVTHRKDVVYRGENDGTAKSTGFAWDRIQKSVKSASGSTLSAKVMSAIKDGVFVGMTSKGRFLTQSQKIQMGLMEDPQTNQRYTQTSDTAMNSDGKEYSVIDKVLAEREQDKITEWSDEDLDALEGKLTDGSLGVEETLQATIILVENEHIELDDPLVTNIQKAFFDGTYNDDDGLLDNAMDFLLKNKILTPDILELARSYFADELNDDDRLDAEYELVNQGWIEDNVEVNVEAKKAVDLIVQKAEELANIAVGNMGIPDGEIGEIVQEAAKLDLETHYLKKLLKMFKEDGFHWMLDANLYLDETEWVKALRESNADSLKQLQRVIEDQQEPLLPVGLRHIFNSSTFTNKDKVTAIKGYADKCMDQEQLKSIFGKTRASLAWFIECAILHNGGVIHVNAGGVSHQIVLSKLSYFSLSGTFYTQLMNVVQFMKGDELEVFITQIENLIKPYKPDSITYSVREWVEVVKKAVDAKKQAKQLKKEINNSGVIALKGFFGAIAVQLLLHRFYLDLGYTEATGDVPKGLGGKDCDAYVRKLMGPIPTSAINEVKDTYYENEILPIWQKEVQKATEKRLEIMLKKKEDLNNNVKATFKALGIEAGSELYDAFVDLE